ncbi:hypothetical protein DC366_14055 [Pelagivirga sediminicola]|uniref:Uncharacterized protein n=1 Tax=Pelagivirga sediminicola TaxID=2170575 RepID=A0A2T7G4Z3_9RHOB|nr:hypothetical protein [Pelagivirga sediminicola]PVA09502.1 hypothetical protein DC366_14055 [Pelagivirga sediminicola]
MPTERELLPKYLTERLAELVLSDDKLAVSSGVNRATIFRIRKGYSFPHTNTLRKLLIALDGGRGIQRYRDYIEKNNATLSESQEISKVQIKHEYKRERKIALHRERQREFITFDNINLSFLARKDELDKFSESQFEETIDACERAFADRTFEVSFTTSSRKRYAIRILPDHIDRINFISAKILGAESFQSLAPLLAIYLQNYSIVALDAEDKNSAYDASKLSETLLCDSGQSRSSHRFDAIFHTADALEEMHKYEDALTCYVRALDVIKDWSSSTLRSLPFLFEDVLDSCIQHFCKRQEFDLQFEALALKVEISDIQLSKPDLEHLKPDVLAPILLDIIKHQIDIWEQDDSTEKIHDAAFTFDSSATKYGKRVQEKLERLIALNEVEI